MRADRHSSTLPSAVVRVDTVQVVPWDDERALVHPRAGEVRFRGASPPFGPLRATVSEETRGDASLLRARIERARKTTPLSESGSERQRLYKAVSWL